METMNAQAKELEIKLKREQIKAKFRQQECGALNEYNQKLQNIKFEKNCELMKLNEELAQYMNKYRTWKQQQEQTK